MKRSDSIIFRSSFLREVWRHLYGKQKRMRYLGAFEMKGDKAGEVESITLLFQGHERPYVAIDFQPNNMANVYLRSAKKSNRGKVLYRLEALRLPSNGKGIANAVIETFRLAEYEQERHPALEKLWADLACKVVSE